VAPGSQPAPGEPAAAETTRFTYDRNSNLTHRITARDDLTFRFSYDDLDRLVSERNPVPGGEEEWTYGYDAAGNRTLETSPRGIVTQTQYDSLDRPVTLVDAVGTDVQRTTRVGYDRDGNEIRLTEAGSLSPHGFADERVTSRTFDGQGGLWKQTIAVGTPLARTTITERDGNGNLVRVVNPKGVEGREPVEPYDQTGGYYGDPGAIGEAATEKAQDAARHATVGEYDENGQLRRTHLPWSPVAPAGETPDSDRLSEAESEATSSDDYGVNHAEENQRKFRQDFGYDNRGRLTSVSDTYLPSDEDVSATEYEYFETGWVKRSTDPPRELDISEEDDDEVDHPGQVLRYGYDERGNQDLWRTSGFRDRDPDGADGPAPEDPDPDDARKITREFYDSGLLEKRTGFKPIPDDGDGPVKRSYSYFYNENRSLVEIRDQMPKFPDNVDIGVNPAACGLPDNQGLQVRCTEIDRDEAEREVAVDEQWKSGRDTKLAYDESGNVTERKTEVGGPGPVKTTDFTFDALDRETVMRAWEGDEEDAEDDGEVRRTETAYHQSGDVYTRERSDGGDEVLYWRPDGLMARMQRAPGLEPGDDVPDEGKDVTYDYDPNGNRTRDERGYHAYNARDQLVLWKGDEDEPLGEDYVTYRLDGNGAIDKKWEPDTEDEGETLVTDFHNLGGRLIRAENEKITSTYFYDELGNAIRIESTPHDGVLPDPDQPPPDTPSCSTGSWDDGKSTYYCYDEFSRQLASRGLKGNDDEEQPDPETYVYDGLDRRDVRISEDGEGDPKVREYSYVGTSELLSREQRPAGSGGGTETSTYDYDSTGSRQGQLEDPASQNPDFRPYRVDANGSVEALEDEGGEVGTDDEYHYDPYGELQDTDTSEGNTKDAEEELSDEARANPFRFQGFYYDSAVKSYDVQARAYRPENGQFLSEDRYEAAGADIGLQTDPLTQNRYAFGGGNPVSRIEFDGHIGWEIAHVHETQSGKAARQYRKRSYTAIYGNPAGIDYTSPYNYPGSSPRPGESAPPPPPPPERDPILPPVGGTSPSAEETRHLTRAERLETASAASYGAVEGVAEAQRCGFGCSMKDGLEFAFGDDPLEIASNLVPVGRAFNLARRGLGAAGKKLGILDNSADEAADAASGGFSALEAASDAAFRASRGPINVSRKHYPGAGGRYSKFGQGVDIDATIRDALQSPDATFRPNRTGGGDLIPGYRVYTDLGHTVGTRGETGVRTIVSPDGQVITAFPGKPWP
jgi:RHS repeat-associated protein